MRTALPLAALGTVALLVLSGCVNNTSTTTQPSATTAVSVDTAAAALLPDDVKKAGKLLIGVDPTYAPNEYKDAAGNPIGWEIELADAAAAKLGLTTSYQAAKFDNILPGLAGGKYDVGLSSFFDTKEREQKFDMVDYYTAGIQWASAKGTTVDPDNACGLTIAVQNGTTEALDDGPAKSKACTDAGKAAITLLGYDTQDEATAAVTMGRAAALSADSPVTQYAVKQSAGKLELAGKPYSVFLYGMPVAQGHGTLAKALAAAIDSLKKDGTYTKILSTWGVEAGAIDTIGINGATS